MERDRVRKLARIIVQVRLKNVSDADRAYLNDWLDEDERNRTMYRRIVRGSVLLGVFVKRMKLVNPLIILRLKNLLFIY